MFDFQFIDDPRWTSLNPNIKRKVISVAFQDQVASDPAWSNLDPNKQRQVEDLFVQDAQAYEQYQTAPLPRGILSSAASHLGRGVVRAAGNLGQVAEMADLTPREADTDTGILDRAGRSVVDWSERKLKESPSLRPDKDELTGQVGFIRRGVMGGIEALPLTASVWAAAGAGTLIGGPPVGYAAGITALVATFGAGTYGQEYSSAYQELSKTRPDMTEQERQDASHRVAFGSAAFEVGTELPENLMALITLGGSKVLTTPIKATIKNLLKKPAKSLLMGTMRQMGVETTGEMIAGGGQAWVRQKEGLSGPSISEGITESIIPAMTMSLFFGAGAAGLNQRQSRKLMNALESMDAGTRIEAAQIMSKRIAANTQDESLASTWLAGAMNTIENGESFDFDQKLVDFASIKMAEDVDRELAAEAAGTPAPITTDNIENAGTPDEAIETFNSILDNRILALPPGQTFELKGKPYEGMDRIHAARVRNQQIIDDPATAVAIEIERNKIARKQLADEAAVRQGRPILPEPGQLGTDRTRGATAGFPSSQTLPAVDPTISQEAEDAQTQDIRGVVPDEQMQPQAERAIGREDDRQAVPADQIEQDTKEKKQVHDYSSTQVDLPTREAIKIRQFGRKIPDSELAEDGREDKPHITVRYGLDTNNIDDVAPAFEGHGPVKAKMGKVSIFETDDYDVVKVDVESPELHELNRKVGETVDLPGETFKDYKPHATIAYVKKGEGKKYVGDKIFEGREITFDSVTLSAKDGSLKTIKLKRKREPQKIETPEAEIGPKPVVQKVPSTEDAEVVSRQKDRRKPLSLPAPETPKDHMNRLLQKAEDRKQKANKIAKDSEGQPVVLTESGTNKKGIIIHKSTKRKGKYQVTNWDDRGFSGDTQHDTLAEAIEDSLSYGYTTLNPKAFERVTKSRKFHKWMEANEIFHKNWTGGEKGEGVIELGASDKAVRKKLQAKREKTDRSSDIKEHPVIKRILTKEFGIQEISNDWLEANDYYVHGRSGSMELSDLGLILLTQDMETAAYYGRGGSIHFFKEPNRGRVLDLSSDNTPDMDKIVTEAKNNSVFDDYIDTPLSDETGQPVKLSSLSTNEIEDLRGEVARSAFAPFDIVTSAEGYDNPDFYQWFYEQFGSQYDFVITPDGAVVLDPKNVDSIAVPYKSEWELADDGGKQEILKYIKSFPEKSKKTTQKAKRGKEIIATEHDYEYRIGPVNDPDMPQMTHQAQMRRKGSDGKWETAMTGMAISRDAALRKFVENFGRIGNIDNLEIIDKRLTKYVDKKKLEKDERTAEEKRKKDELEKERKKEEAKARERDLNEAAIAITMKKAKAKRGDIKVVLAESKEKVDVDAFIIGDYAYHQGVGTTSYSVTHIPSGGATKRGLSKKEARELTYRFSLIPEKWNGKGSPPSKFQEAGRLIVKEFRDRIPLAPEKVTKSVKKKAKPKTPGKSLKEQREYLLYKIDEAIEQEAKEYAKGNNLKNPASRDTIDSVIELMKAGQIGGLTGKHTFTIAGAEYNVLGSGLVEFRKKASAELLSRKKYPFKGGGISFAARDRAYKKLIFNPSKMELSDYERARNSLPREERNYFDNWVLNQNISKKTFKDIIKNSEGTSGLFNDISFYGAELIRSGVKTLDKFRIEMRKVFVDIWGTLKNYIKELFTISRDAVASVSPGGTATMPGRPPTTEKPKTTYGDTLAPVTDEDYEKNREQTRSIKGRATVGVKRILNDVKEIADKYLGSISTRLGNASPELKAKVRKLGMDEAKAAARSVKAVMPMLEKAKASMSKKDFIDWDYARKNSDIDKINELIERYDLQDEYKAYRDTLDRIRKEALAVGLEVGWIEEYAPRVLKDSRGFLEAIGMGPGDVGDDIYSRKIKEVADGLEISVSELSWDQKADIVSNMILGGPTGLGGPSATKPRKLKKILPEINQFYMDSDSALMAHIHTMHKHIEARKFFGKVPERVARAKKLLRSNETRLRKLLKESEPDETRIKEIRSRIREYNAIIYKYKHMHDYKEHIGSYIVELIAKKQIKDHQQRIVNDILQARFHERGTHGIVQFYKNWSYLDTMGSPISALTQIGDLAWAAYEGGFIRALKHAHRSLRGKSRITKEDVGIVRIAQEFADSGTLADAVSKVFKLVGLEKIDSIGKEALLNSALEKYQAQAKKNPKILKAKIRHIFENETDDVIQDLIDDQITDNVKLLVYNRLLDFQPVALSEMPQKYLDAGNGRLFYMLKTFTIKQFDVFRNECFRKIGSGNKAEVKEGLQNLIRLSMFFVLANAGADEIKDLVLGRKTDLKDRVADNVLRLFGASKFITWKARTEGAGTALSRQILFPVKFIDAITKDVITAGDEKGLEIVGSIPVAGKLAYWHMGRGTHKRQDLWEHRLKKEKRRLNKIKDRMESASNKTAFMRKHRKSITRLKALNRLQAKLNKNKNHINRLKANVQSPGRTRMIKRLTENRIQLIRQFLGRR